MNVVEVLGGVVEDAGVLAEARLDDLFEALTLEAGAGQKLVQIVHISLVVLVVVKLERLGRHIRLERFVRVRQGGKFKGHGDYSQKFAQGKVRRKLMVPLGRGKPRARAGANQAQKLDLGEVGAEPLNPAPGAEEGSLTSVQGPDAFHSAAPHLNAA
jgi:hypothetical protein